MPPILLGTLHHFSPAAAADRGMYVDAMLGVPAAGAAEAPPTLVLPAPLTAPAREPGGAASPAACALCAPTRTLGPTDAVAAGPHPEFTPAFSPV